MKLDLSNTVGRSIWWRGTYGRHIGTLLKSRLTIGDAFVDVGANVGWFSLLAAKLVGPGGLVIAFEPNPTVCSALAESAYRNSFGQILPVCLSVASHAGVERFQVQRSSGISFLGDSAHKKDGDHVVMDLASPTITLDSFVPPLLSGRTLRLVKIDVEGRELDVIHGATNLLQKHRPALIVEICKHNLERFDVQVGSVVEALQTAGYVSHGAADPQGSGNLGDILFLPMPA